MEHAVGSDIILRHPIQLPSSGLDAKTNALVRLAALLAVGSSQPCHSLFVRRAVDSGATVDEVLGTMTTVAPVVGLGSLMTAVPKIALGLGFDIDVALEELDPPACAAEPDCAP